MDEAQKREKVIKGLECCKTDVPFSECDKCPYVTRIDRDGFIIACNREDMMSDAIALIKAQEAIKSQKMENDCIRKESIVISYRCPSCFTCLQKHWDTCPVCGQKVKWR